MQVGRPSTDKTGPPVFVLVLRYPVDHFIYIVLCLPGQLAVPIRCLQDQFFLRWKVPPPPIKAHAVQFPADLIFYLPYLERFSRLRCTSTGAVRSCHHLIAGAVRFRPISSKTDAVGRHCSWLWRGLLVIFKRKYLFDNVSESHVRCQIEISSKF